MSWHIMYACEYVDISVTRPLSLNLHLIESRDTCAHSSRDTCAHSYDIEAV